MGILVQKGVQKVVILGPEGDGFLTSHGGAGGVPWCTYPARVHLPWYTTLSYPVLHLPGYTTSVTTPVTASSMPASLSTVYREDSLGSEALCSLGGKPSREA